MELTPRVRDDLIARARAVRRHAYAPYSRYSVGAALLTDSGAIIEGVNVENAAYPAGICAERAAVFAAVARGERVFRAIAVVSDDGGSPCGSCRQVLSEFSPEMRVWIADGEGKLIRDISVRELLPQAFGPDNLART